MARVVLHIGTHKTGSTAVQNALAANRQILADHGIVYPVLTRGQPAHHGLVALWNKRLAPYEPRGGAEAAWRDLARRHARGPGTLLLSSEELGRTQGAMRTDFGWIRDVLAPFEEVEVVCLLRDQISFTQSLYLEIAKHEPAARRGNPPVPRWETYLKPAIAKRTAGGLALDYNWILDRLAQAFAPDRIHFIPYARAVERPNGAIGAVLERVAPGLDLARLAVPDGGRANVTDDPLAVWAAAQLTVPHPPRPGAIGCARELIAERFAGRTTIYTLREMREMMALYGPANARLAKRLRARDPAFALPWPEVKGTVRRNRLDHEFWIELTRRVHGWG